MKKWFIISFVLGVLFGILAMSTFLSLKNLQTGEVVDYGGAIVLMKEYENGSVKITGVRAPYDLTGAYSQVSLMRLSPDRSKVLYTVWENSGVSIYVSDVHQNSSKMVARQEVAEGSGGIDADSVTWLEDSNTILYQENEITCEGSCSTPDDFRSISNVFQVNIDTGVKTRIDTASP